MTYETWKLEIGVSWSGAKNKWRARVGWYLLEDNDVKFQGSSCVRENAPLQMEVIAMLMALKEEIPT